MEQQNMKVVDITKLEGKALDWAVAVACDMNVTIGGGYPLTPQKKNWPPLIFNPSEDWSLCGPLIEQHRIEVIFAGKVTYAKVYEEKDAAGWGSTPLIAVCRALVLHKLGDTIPVPAELINQQ